MSPNPDRQEKGAPEERSYIVSAKDVATCPLVAKLVVISGGWSTYKRDKVEETNLLSSAFLVAGKIWLNSWQFILF